MGHDHAPATGTMTARYRRRLVAVLLITATVFLAQVIGGLAAGSLALLADAGHMLTDAGGVAIALIASTLAQRPASDARTYGWQRAEILAALVNALLLTGIAVWVLVSAMRRWDDEPEINSGLMLAVAVGGAVANLVSLLLLRQGQSQSLNVRGAYLEVLGDLLGSLAVIVAGVVILTTGWTRADVVASLAIGILILPRAWSLLRDTVDVLLEATPRDVDLADVRRHMLELPAVVDVHDLHAWTITSGSKVLSAHVVVDDLHLSNGRSGEVLDHLGECLSGHFDVEHCTFQLEPRSHRDHEAVVH